MGFLKFLKRDKGKVMDFEGMDDLDAPPLPPGMENKGIPNVGAGKFPELPEIPKMSDEAPIERPRSDIDLASNDFKEDISPGSGNLDMDGDIENLEMEKPEKQLFGSRPGPLFGAKESNKEVVQSQETIPEVEDGFEKIAPTKTRRPLFGKVARPIVEEKDVDLNAERLHPKPIPDLNPYEKIEKDAISDEMAVLRHKGSKGPIYLRVERFRELLSGSNQIRNDLKIASQSISKLNEIDVRREKIFDKWRNIMVDAQKKLIFMERSIFNK